MNPAVGAAVTVARNPKARKLLLTLLVGLVLSLLTVVVVTVSSVGAVAAMCQQQSQQTAAPGGTPDGFVTTKPSQKALSDIPSNYLPVYQAAAKKYGIDWAILAAMGKIETEHGQGGKEETCITSSAGAQGPMQFTPPTWASEGVDGNGDGKTDACNYQDAIYGAANYLVDSGAPQDYHSAILSYNHAEWYYQKIIKQAQVYRSAQTQAPSQASNPSSDSSGQGGGQGGSSPASSSWRPSGGGGQPPQGWDLVDSSRHIDYELHTQYASSFEAAAAAWNKLGGVKIEPSPSPSQTDLVVSDSTSIGGLGGQTGSDGAMYFNPDSLSGATDNAKQATAAHELGHALGFDHTTQPSAMNTPEVINSDQNHAVPTPYDISLYRQVWGGSSTPDQASGNDGSGGSGQGGSGSGGGGGEKVQGNQKAVFPLPKEDFGSYDDTWGASRPQNGGGAAHVHEGTDMMTSKGTPIYSITSGEVVKSYGADSSGWDSLGGWIVMVKADYSIGPIHDGDELYYAHQEKVEVQSGTHVKAGQVIGHVGDSGQGPPGTTGQFEPHLHLGWYDPTGARDQSPDGTGAMNPYPLLQWLKGNGGTATGGSSDLSPSPGGGGTPAYCLPFKAFGILSDIGRSVSDFLGGGGKGQGSDRPPANQGIASPAKKPPAPGSSQKPTGDAGQVLDAAKEYLGDPYVLGGANSSGIDCSGLVIRAYEAVGIELPHWDDKQMNYGRPVDKSALQPGDVVFFSEPGLAPDGAHGVTHVAIYIGNGQMIHASHYFGKVVISDMDYVQGYIGARRML